MGLRALLRSVLPDSLLTPLLAVRARRHSHRLNAQWGVSGLSEKLFDRLGSRVLDGPFKGLQIPRAASAEHLGPYLLGTYERELHQFWSALPRGSVPLIVNVGAKFGYYAAGLARLLDAPAVAYDADPWARALVRETSNLNQTRVTVRGRCTREDLEQLPPKTLVVIDCDGCEEVLLRDPVPHGILQSTVVVELHDDVISGDDVRTALKRSHAIEELPSIQPPPPPPALDFLDAQQRKLAVDEIRTPQRWLVCTPRRS